MSISQPSARPSTVAIFIALGAIYILWGGTYLGMRFAIETLPVFLMAGTRFLTAGLLLFIVNLVRGIPAPSLQQWRGAGIVGALLLMGGNGCVVWAQQFVPSGLTAIIVATVPLWMALFSWLAPGGVRPTPTVIAGLCLGFSGILFLVNGATTPAVSNAVSQWVGYTVLTLAAITWSLGSLYARHAALPKSPWMAIAVQMIVGGSLLLLTGLASGEWASLDLGRASARSLLAFGYLVVFGSLIGFSAYIWLLHKTTPALASTYAYVNPVIAVFLGWALADERFTSTDAAAAAIIVVSVAVICIGTARSSQRAKPPVDDKK